MHFVNLIFCLKVHKPSTSHKLFFLNTSVKGLFVDMNKNASLNMFSNSTQHEMVQINLQLSCLKNKFYMGLSLKDLFSSYSSQGKSIPGRLIQMGVPQSNFQLVLVRSEIGLRSRSKYWTM